MKIKAIDSSCSRRDLRVIQVRGAAVREFQGRWWEGRPCGGQQECAQSHEYDKDCIKIEVCEARDSRLRQHRTKGRDHGHAVMLTVFRNGEVWDSVITVSISRLTRHHFAKGENGKERTPLKGMTIIQ